MVISIITLNYKKHELTLACMASLYDQLTAEFEKGKIELLIVDNHSEDDSVRSLRKIIKDRDYKNCRVIESPENGGFGKGCNLGAAAAKGEILLFLNNDTIVKDQSIVAMATYLSEHKQISILGGQLHNPDGSLQASAGSFYTFGKALMLLLGMQRYGLLDKSPKDICQVDWVKGGMLMIKRDVFEQLGGFDENIFMYIEDMELCFRAKKAGFATYFYPFTHVVHAEHGSTNRTFAIVNIYKNLLYFYRKHHSSLEYMSIKTVLMLKAFLLIITGYLFRNQYLIQTYKKALAGIM